MSERKYLKIGEAAVRYHVSRVKLWRLIQSGRISAIRDPRDERAKLVREEDVVNALTITSTANDTPKGRLTPELVARMDEFVAEVFKEKKGPEDSTELIRVEREKRSQEIERRVSGKLE